MISFKHYAMQLHHMVLYSTFEVHLKYSKSDREAIKGELIACIHGKNNQNEREF